MSGLYDFLSGIELFIEINKKKRRKRENERKGVRKKDLCQGQKSCKLRSTERNKRQTEREKEPDSRDRRDNPRTLFLPIDIVRMYVRSIGSTGIDL